MSKKDRRDTNNPAQDFIDLQEHRLDPGYWTTEVYGKGRRFPFPKDLLEQHVSSFHRALMIFVLLSPLCIGLFLRLLNDRLSHPWFWCTITLVAVFLGIWYFMHKSMIRNGCAVAKKPNQHSSKRR
jgi:hypothetical protein